jgi:DNA-binding transcriptional LysR family regulator
VTPELRQLRYFVAVAERGSFVRAAEDLHIAQQAVSQQVKALEAALGVTLLRRTSRHVELTPQGAVFLGDCRRLLAAADRAVRRVQAAARGEAGTLRVVYTLTTAYDTVPAILARLGESVPQLRVDAREIFADDVGRLLLAEQCDLALAPATAYPRGLRQQVVRREPLRLAVGEAHRLAGSTRASLSGIHGERLELWPREMAPGFYDAVMSACRAAGLEPQLDEHAAGSTVWGSIAAGRGVGLVVASLSEQLPSGVRLLDLGPPEPPPVSISAVWRDERPPPAVSRFLQVAAQLAAEYGWT